MKITSPLPQNCSRLAECDKETDLFFFYFFFWRGGAVSKFSQLDNDIRLPIKQLMDRTFGNTARGERT